jgi:hypothetical protein
MLGPAALRDRGKATELDSEIARSGLVKVAAHRVDSKIAFLFAVFRFRKTEAAPC